MKELGLVGAAIGGNVEGEEIASAKFDPFWKKAEELQALIFIHPQTAPQSTGIAKRVQGSGALGNVIGNPLETSLALVASDLRGHARQVPESEDLRRAWRRLPALLRGAHGPRLLGVPGAVQRARR